MLYVATRPIIGVIAGLLTRDTIVSVGRESKHFDGIEVSYADKNVFVRAGDFTDKSLAPVKECFKVHTVLDLDTGDEYHFSCLNEMSALDIIVRNETGKTINENGGFIEGGYSFGCLNFAALRED